MEDEILNIEFHVKRLVLKALNKFSHAEAAAKLGISLRQLYRRKVDCGIIWDGKKWSEQATKKVIKKVT